MNTFTRFFVLVIVVGSILGCSRKKDKFINRNWHAVTTEYNTLYNGNLALDQGREELIENYEDNFWDILPIERMQIDEQILLPDSIRNQNFGIAEEKAVKAIQKHSMLIGGKERNPQIDEAYLLLGKARYYEQRFIPALEAFNYILHKYPASNNINNAQIWREKTNMRLDNNRLAIQNLKDILKQEELKSKAFADANATLAQAFVNLQLLDSAVVPLKKAAEITDKNEEKGRYYFILGQLYNRIDQPELANQAFDEVIALNRKSPRIYMINAYVEKARNFDYNQGDNYRLRELLTELEEDRENRPYLDKIYFQIGEYYRNIDSTRLAVEYYNKSLKSPVSDKYLKSINYEILADRNFEDARYRDASKYYDSTLAVMSPRLREYRTIKKKRDNLEDVILYEETLAKNDSILMLSSMLPAEQLEYFTAHIEGLKAKADADMLSDDFAANLPETALPAPGAMPTPGGARTFYFYNESRLQNGLQDFKRTWGNRPLADNWRWGEVGFVEGDTTEESEIAEINFEEDPRFDPQTYINMIPTDQRILDSLENDRNMARYQLGIIYKEKYGEYDLAAEKLEALLEDSEDESLRLPAKYNLYQIYGMTGQLTDQENMKQDIFNNHADSRYANYILNPESVTEDENSPEAVYAEVFRDFEDEKYDEVLVEANKYINEYSGEEILPKFELLKAMATGRLLGLEAYKNALNHVALTYPQTEEGRKAKELNSNTIPALSEMEFNRDSLQTNFKLISSFDISEKEEASSLKESLDNAIEKIGYDLKTSVDIYDPATVFVVVHGLEDQERALGFSELLQNKEFKINKDFIAISAENYRIVQIHKNLDIYQSPNN
ncbi:tetratricopeptide repeat protein [Salegentibacter sp.]|uniref:type IX secretion system periplasmic lipoprotein PorW/SprE n=1 Tax=Salegentibacter sp. TaxID=1903072 RepID=UPI003561867C